MKKLISVLLALVLVMSSFMCASLSASAESSEALTITVNGITTAVPVGETFVYTYSLTDLTISNCEAVLYYDTDLLKITSPDEDDDDAVDLFKQTSFPVIYESVVYNTALVDKARFNCTNIDGFKFRGEQTLATFEFTVLSGGTATIEMQILEMLDANKEYIVKKNANAGQVMKEFIHGEYITYEAPEVPTEPETEPTEPETEPTEPETEPTEPETQPTEPVPTKPIKVENFTYTSTANTISLSWEAAEGCYKYWIYKYNEETDVWSIAASTYETSGIVKFLSPNTTYQLKVIGKFQDDSSYMLLDNADVFEATTAPAAAPGSMDITPGLGEATISWDAVEGATKYWVYKASNIDGPYYIAWSTTDTTALMQNLRNDMTYYFRIASLTTQNGVPCISDYMDSPVVSIETPKSTEITTKLDLNTSTTASISWNAINGADKYWVMYSTTTNDTTQTSQWTTAGTTTDVTTFNIRKLTANTVYHIFVRARYTDALGAVKTYDYIPVTMRTAYSDDAFLTFAKVNSYITITWPEDVTGITKSWVYAYDANGTQMAMSSTTTNQAILKQFEGFEDCYYVVYTLDANGNYGYLTPTGGEYYHE